MKTVLSAKAVKGLIVVDDLTLKVSTKAFAKDLAALKAEGKTLVVVPEKNDKLCSRALATSLTSVSSKRTTCPSMTSSMPRTSSSAKTTSKSSKEVSANG
jgi:hypothetical protein